MTQRQRRSLEQDIQQTYNELVPYLQEFNEFLGENMTSSDSASLIISMISKASSPITGIQLLRNNLAEMNFQYMNLYDMLINKAEMLYYQSFMQDLRRIKNDEVVVENSKEQIKKCIQQLNWKLSVDSASILNDSQQVEQNKDLMKFFEGIRNYQKWQEGIKFQSLQKLKQKANQIQKEVIFKKGFIISKIDSISEKIIYRNLQEFFTASKKRALYLNVKRLLKKISTRKLHEAFSQIYLRSISPQRGNFVLYKMFEAYYPRKFLGQTRKTFLSIKNCKDCLQTLSKSLRQFKSKREINLKNFAFSKLNLKLIIKASKITQSVQRLAQLSKKVIVRHMFKQFNIVPKVIFMKLSQVYYDRTETFFKLMKQNYFQAKLRRPNISERLKGKILVSLNKYQREPLSIKKIFDRWYLNSHSEKYTKKIYNIRLQGNINKFVVFMRFKNLCENVNRQMIGKQMQNFIRIICEKYDKYEEFNKKLMLKKWIENNRKIKKVEKLVKTLKKIQNQTKIAYAKHALEKFTEFCKKRQIIKNYLSKYLLNFISNRKKAIQKWTIINNLKKGWGKNKLRVILLNIAHQMNQTARQTLNVFKANRAEGRSKKLAQYHRTFSQYGIAFEKIIQIWKFNSNSTRLQQQIAVQNITKAKYNSISQIAYTQNRVEALNIRDIILKFKQCAKQKARKINNIENSFIKIMEKQQSFLKKDLLEILVQNWREGKFKKQKLVIQLVHSNVVKQKLSINILKNKSKFDTQLIKRHQMTRIYDILQDKVKQNLIIFNRKLFVGKILQKIINNHTSNLQNSLDKWKALPLRIRWNLRKKILKLNDTLCSLRLNHFKQSQEQFKNANHLAKTKKKRGVYIMANKFQVMIRKYFKKYHLNSLQLKQNDKIARVTHLFEATQKITKQNMATIMKAKAQWPKRLHYFERLNEILQRRFRNYFLTWNNLSKQITTQNLVKTEKKIRFLQNLNRIIENRYLQQTKSSIESFNKNRRIHNLQINFLKKLCQGRAGKLYKGFSVWKSMPLPKNKQFIRRCTVFQTRLTKYISNIMKQTLKAFKRSRQQGKVKKRQIIYLFLQNSCMSIRKYFDKWKTNKNLITLTQKNNKIENLFESAFQKNKEFMSLLMQGNQAQQKRRALGLIENWWMNQEKYYLKKWHKNIQNLKIMDINKRHLLSNLNKIVINSEKQMLKQNIIKKLIQNRNAAVTQKSNKKVEGILRVIDCQSAFKRQLLNQTIDKLKFSHYWGNFKKNNIFHKFLKQKIGTVHNILTFWNTLANQVKETHKQRMVTQNFDLFNQTIKANYRIILSKTRDEAIKKHYLDRLFNNQQLKFKGYFNLWRQRVKQLNILGQLDKKAKASILQRINKILSATSTQSVVSTIRKFHQNFKITQVQRKFMDKILQTKSGKLVNAFNNWKSIPMNLMKGKYKNYQKFYFNLENFYKNRLKKVNDSFKQYCDDGNLMKKQSILKLFQMTSLGIRRFYNRWTRFTRQKHSLMQVHNTLKAFANVEGTLENQYKIIFLDKHAYKGKIKSIQRLVQVSKQKLSNYINKWRQIKQNLKVQANRVKQQKIRALKNLNTLTLNSQMGQAIHIIKMFDKNKKMNKISKNFLTRLMLTKTGKVLQFFSVMKTLPDAKLNKRKRRGIIFESKLFNFVLKRLRDTLNPFKENTYDAQAKMKYCISRLIRACMGQNQKKFLIWRNVVREGKILKHTSLFQKFFNIIQKESKQNFSALIKDTKGQIQKKKALCRKLINNSSFVQHHAFLLWRQSCRIEDLNTVKKQIVNKNHLKNLESVLKQHQNKQVIQAINEFRRLLQLRNVQEYTYIKQYKNKRCLQFYNGLKLIQKYRKSVFIDALKKGKTDTMLADQSQKLEAAFKAMQFSCQKNMNYVFKTSDQTALLERVFNKLYENQKINMDKAVSLWIQKKNALIFQQIAKKQRKRRSLKLINSIYLTSNNKKIIIAINKFRTNQVLKDMKKRICLKILARKTNNFSLSFKNWKNVPYQQAKKLKPKAAKFEKGLVNFFKNNLKETLWAFKQNRLCGVFKKQNAVRSIVRSRLIQSNKLFFSWRKYNNQSKIKEKIVTLDKFLNNTEVLFKNNFMIYQGSKVNDQRKIRATTQLFNNNVKRLREYLKTWQRSTKTIKYHLFEKYMRNFNPEDFNKRLLKIGWFMIVKKKDMQMMKGYINSLWKWKMSSIQANYYSKFIKIMKQSEQMVKFSNLLNKKIYENIHHSFRNIMSASNQKTNRKREIVEKYLMRRFRNYFITLKNATLHTQINVWKSKYTDVIKAKILYQVLSTLILKSKFVAFTTLKNYELYTNKIQSMQRKIINFQQSFLREAFEKIKHTAHRKIFQIASLLQAKCKKERLNECFQLLKQKLKIQKLIHHISIAILQKFLHAGFNAINKKKQRVIKSKLSIILLQTLIQKSQTDEKRDITHKFRANRLKNLATQKIFKILDKKYKQNTTIFYERGQALIDVNKFLQRLKRAEILKKIVERQDIKLQKQYLNKMRKKENKWMELAIQKFATRASLRSSPAISLWRLKTYIVNS